MYRWIKSLCAKCGLLGCKKNAHELRAVSNPFTSVLLDVSLLLPQTSEISVDLEEVDEDVQAEGIKIVDYQAKALRFFP